MNRLLLSAGLALGLFSCGTPGRTGEGPGTFPDASAGGTGGRGGSPAPTGSGGAPSTPPDAAGDSTMPPDAPPPVTDASGDGPAETSSPASPSACAKLIDGEGPASQWVFRGPDGKLVYKALNPQGDRIMDFSHAGYRGGGVPLPNVPVQAMLAPSGADDTAALQAAIDQVSARPLVDGFRGAVLLAPGTFRSSATIFIRESGVVLRGSGSGMGGTEIQLGGLPHRFLILQGTGMRVVDAASAQTITDAHVPAGSNSFTVASAAGFKVGDQVLVGRPVTDKWLALMGMDQLVRNGAPQTWIRAGSVLNAERVITAIAGNRITIDVPLADSMAGEYVSPPGASLTRYTFDRVSNIGVEHLRVVGQPREEMVNFNFLQINTVVDAWVKDVVAHDVTTGVGTNGDAKRITIEDTIISHTMVDYVSPAKPADFNIDGAEVLIHRSASRGSNRSFSMITQSGVPGPTVVLNFAVSGINPPLQPHQRWATGLLVDNAKMEAGNIEFIDRTNLGTGHGWTVGWAVAWNSIAPSFRIELPPGSMNWSIGGKGNMAAPGAGHASGIFDSHGTPVSIKSLYLAQLCERLGPQALVNIGYK